MRHDDAGIRPSSLVDLITARAERHPDRTAFTFLANDDEPGRLTYGQLDRHARGVAAHLRRTGAEPGDRGLLLHPPGLDFIAAFCGCLYAGVVAVPAYPPRRRQDARLRAIATDARPRFVLTTPEIRARTGGEPVPALREATWLTTADHPDDWRPPVLDGDSLAFLQYTSGSTATPKGVMVTHGNLLDNERVIRQACRHSEQTVMVGWLPLYHDMGLIGNVLQPLYVGGSCVLMSPTSFLERPLRWLEAISRYRGTTSGGPNFGYDLCLRKISAADRRGLDLSSWTVAFNGAEPVRAETLERFARVYAPFGFDRRAFFPCYGLAEATLYVTGASRDQGPVVEWLDPEALARNRVALVSGLRERILVGCGRPGQEVRIVDPDSRRECPPDRVGEIWVRGPSVARGYWGRPEETARDFDARLADEEDGGPWLRTGDLGFFLDGELFVTGRLKDLVIRGRNLYPQDIEVTAGESHPALRPGGGAAFSVDVDGEERLVVVHELVKHGKAIDLDAVVDALRRAVTEEHEVVVWDVVLIRSRTLLKTSSGKVRRRACRDAYLAGRLTVVATARTEAEPELPPAAGEERLDVLRHRLARLTDADPARVPTDRPITALGLDSLRATELRSAIEEEWSGARIPGIRQRFWWPGWWPRGGAGAARAARVSAPDAA